MRKIYFLALSLMFSWSVVAETTIDISAIDAAYTTTFDQSLVIDVKTTASKVASPKLSFANPFKDLTFTEIEISFDVYNYGNSAYLGSLLALYDGALGRMYFSNGTYLGYNATGGWFDSNIRNQQDPWTPGTDFIGSATWKNVKIKFTSTGYGVYFDDVLAYDNASTGDAFNKGNLTDFTQPLSFFKNAATLVIGTGSWWSDNVNSADGSYWDAQNSYLKNITFTALNPSAIVKTAIGESSEIAKIEFYSVTGSSAGSDYELLSSGIYVKKSIFKNGAVKSEKIVKNK